MTIFHYTKVEDDRIKANGTVLTQKQVDKMASDWKQLIKDNCSSKSWR